jgi:hypothetical protein
MPSAASWAVGGVYVTGAPAVLVAYATTVPGTLLKSGAVESETTTLKLPVALLPIES